MFDCVSSLNGSVVVLFYISFLLSCLLCWLHAYHCTWKTLGGLKPDWTLWTLSLRPHPISCSYTLFTFFFDLIMETLHFVFFLMHWITLFILIITFLFAFCQLLLWKGAFYPDVSIFSPFCFCFSALSMTLPLYWWEHIKLRKTLVQKVKIDTKKTNSRQLCMSDYCKMTNKEAMVLFLHSVFVVKSFWLWC